MEPYHTSERMTIQQGVFLCASSLAFRFETALGSMLATAPEATCLIRLEVSPSARVSLLAELDRMNITEATLFPGLDGFARSLRASAQIPGRAPDGMTKLMMGGDPSIKPKR